MKTSTFLKPLFVALLLTTMSLTASAYDFMVDGIAYNINGASVVTVTFLGNNNYYSGDINIPSSVTYNGITYAVRFIGNAAFSNCVDLTSVVIPNSVQSINAETFNGCSGLVNVTIPNSIIIIGDNAFKDCSSLTSVFIPNSVTDISYNAFWGCSGLVSIKVDSNNQVYDSRDNCNAIIQTSKNNLLFGCKNTIIPNTVTSIGMAFYNCSGLTSINIHNSITSISGLAFAGCTNLESVNWNAINCNDFSDDYGPFRGLSNIKTFSFGEEVEHIPANLCAGLTGLTSVIIPNSVSSVGKRAFLNCSGLANITIGNSVASFGIFAFASCSSLTDVTLPSSVTTITEGLFMDCSNLKSVTIPNSITSIEKRVFDGCGSLTSVTIPNSVSSIGEDSFRNCMGLTTVYWNAKNCNGFSSTSAPFRGIGIKSFFIGEEVECLPSYLCKGLSELTSITISNSVTSIGYGVFHECWGLTSMKVESGNHVYDSRNNCNAIIETASNMLFLGCKNTIIPNSVTSIGSSAFYNCKGLISISIPNSVTEIVGFYGCSDLTNVTFGNSVVSIGGNAFSECSSLKSIIIPNSVTSIGDDAFSKCSSLKSIIIPNSVTSMGGGIFRDCTSMTNVTIGNSVKTIGNGAFRGCTALGDVICLLPKPIVIDASVFQDVPVHGYCDLHVPEGTKVRYEAMDVWKEFAIIVEDAGQGGGQTGIKGDVNGDGKVNVSDVAALINIILGII